MKHNAQTFITVVAVGVWFYLISGVELYAQTQDQFHVVTVSGHAEVIQSGIARGRIPLRNGMMLSRNDSVEIGSDAHVLVISEDGALATLSTNCSGRLADCLVLREADGRKNSPWLSILKAISVVIGGTKAQTMISASVRGAEMSEKPQLVLLSPRNSAVLPSQVVLYWHPVEGAKSYRVTISQGLQPLWEKSVESCTECKVSIPQGIIQKGQRYFWTIRANLEDSILERTTMFRVLSADSVNLLETTLAKFTKLESQNDDWTRAQLVSLVYTSFGLYNDAIRVLQSATAPSQDDDERRHELVLGLLRTMDVKPAEVSAFETQ